MDIRELLAAEFERRWQRNSRYSLRGFARSIGFHHSTLSRIIRRRQRVTARMADSRMKKRRVPCGTVQSMGWGLLTQLTLPGGGTLGVYEPRHARPKPMRATAKKSRKAAAR